MNFSKLIGNEKTKEKLYSLIESKRLPQAIVIQGDDGTGKKTLAKEIAMAICCRSEDEKPCRKCSQCIKVEKEIHPDIYQFVATGGKNSYKVDNLRKEVINDACIMPNEANYKIYILANCQYMNESCQNALLKIMEEPPAHVLFILTVNNKSALLSTVLSRSVVISTSSVSAQLGADYIVAKNSEIEYSKALQSMVVCNGNIGKAIDSMDDGQLSQYIKIAQDICTTMGKDNEYDLLKTCFVFQHNRDTIVAVTSILKTIFRDALLYNENSDILSGETQIVKDLSKNYRKENLIKLIQASDNISILANKNGNNALLITKICYEFRQALSR